LYSKSKVEETVKKFEAVSVTWRTMSVDGSNGQIMLQPGYKYELSATISLYPEYAIDRFMVETVKGFGHFIRDTKISKSKLDYFSRQKCVVVYKIEIDDSEVQRIWIHQQPYTDFIANIGGAMGFLSFGIVFLRVWQKILRQEQRNKEWAVQNNTVEAAEKKNEEEEEEEEEEAGRFKFHLIKKLSAQGLKAAKSTVSKTQLGQKMQKKLFSSSSKDQPKAVKIEEEEAKTS